MGINGEKGLITFLRGKRGRARASRTLGAAAVRDMIDFATHEGGRVMILASAYHEVVLTFGRRGRQHCYANRPPLPTTANAYQQSPLVLAGSN